MVNLAPSILSADFSDLRNQIKRVESTGVKYLHLDVMDGHFVPNITFGAPIIKKLKPYSNLIFDVHLMIENPEKYIDDFIDAGADIITIHSEVSYHMHKLIQNIKSKGIMAGISINPATNINDIYYVLNMVDIVLVMSVNPGFGGQKFIESSLEKIKNINIIKKEKKFKYLVEVDGGINSNTASAVIQSGADILVAGSAVFNNDEIENNIKKLNQVLNSGGDTN